MINIETDSRSDADGQIRLRDKCGVFAVYGVNRAALSIFNGLFALQHRGQESAGMVVSDGSEMRYSKAMGLVNEVFSGGFVECLPGNIGIGHVRYSTTGDSSPANVQPFLADCRDGVWAVAHNGNLVNAARLRERYRQQGAIFQTSTDSEILLHQLADPAYFERKDRVCQMLAELRGSFAIVIARLNCIYAARDPWGIKPLSLGRLGDGYMVSSETCAMLQNNAEFIRDIAPGELIKIDENGVKSMRFAEVPRDGKYGQCVFEHIYFARPDSYLFGQSVYKVRETIGAVLAKEHPVEADVVVPIPDSGVLAAMGYAQQSGIHFEMGFIRNHYVGRTFIMPTQGERNISVDLKLAIVPEVVAGKRVVLIDDSIVRGTTIKKRIEMLRAAGATQVHVRIACPPTRHPCYFGIDFPDSTELVAHGRSIAQVKELIGADSCGYLSVKGLSSVLNESRHFCMGCFNGEYVCETHQATCRQALGRSCGNNLRNRYGNRV